MVMMLNDGIKMIMMVVGMRQLSAQNQPASRAHGSGMLGSPSWPWLGPKTQMRL